MASLNLEKQLTFYGSYHHNPVNIGVHITCVPLIMMTAFLFLSNTPAVSLPEWLSVPNLPLNAGTFFCALYSILYILMEPVAGGLLTPLLFAGTAFVQHLVATYGALANYWAIGLHIFSWIAQFIGHGKFEGRAPALLDNIVQALFLAPLFVWLEVLFYFGYRPELQSRIEKAVQDNLKKFREERQKKLAANGAANGTKKAT
ncbi:uncharacterized protein K452DRAFT_283030 [Aplosporella prunicola CBS 121167]|uniref:DUF962 domain-containing protein n=1 Tax=Aplosporella prunicola CBS 121167 TaxID=1176127 RepID=A0A6A6BU83_9PEZI|nr:uncharacterized protein K452DRAFT_283030 [Aplosporella prunicola CBS 121167]KAF2146825.1 hypothetical protein K452DRAFT_283030 [Aplosporella prunicola CBS 121167]